jgi:hypothetical protein
MSPGVARSTQNSEMRARVRELSAIEKRQREDILRLPGVQGIGTGLSSNDTEKIVIRVYVLQGQATPELRAQIASLLGDAPLEIVETSGFSAR